MKRSMLFRATATLTVVVAFLFVTQPASAAPFAPPTITSNIPTPDGGFTYVNGVPVEVSVFEDQSTHTITELFTITNTNSQTMNALTYGAAAFFVGGDDTDVVGGVAVVGTAGRVEVGEADAVENVRACPVSATTAAPGPGLAAGATCGVQITLDLPDVLDYGDFGISKVVLQSTYRSGGVVYTTDLPFDVQVKDAPTPEPSSLILLSTGLLGLAGAMRRKLSRS